MTRSLPRRLLDTDRYHAETTVIDGGRHCPSKTLPLVITASNTDDSVYSLWALVHHRVNIIRRTRLSTVLSLRTETAAAADSNPPPLPPSSFSLIYASLSLPPPLSLCLCLSLPSLTSRRLSLPNPPSLPPSISVFFVYQGFSVYISVDFLGTLRKLYEGQNNPTKTTSIKNDQQITITIAQLINRVITCQHIKSSKSILI